MSKIRIGIVGCGGITLQNHVPGVAMCHNLAEITAVADIFEPNLHKVAGLTGATTTSTDYRDIVSRDDVDAIVIATATDTHMEVARAAIEHGKHVLCEKPLALNHADARAIAELADARKVVHMTAFTYQFVPGMRYLMHLVRAGAIGTPYHLRSCRLQDWGSRNLGWRQVKKAAGTGELGDMLSHRVNFAHELYGDMRRLVAGLKQFIPTRGGAPSDLDDWSALMVEFANGATGMMESSKLATGRNESWRSQDYLEINGSDGSYVFFTERWNQLQVGKPNGPGLETITIPEDFWTWPGSPRNPHEGDPLVNFRYDQMFEFLDAIRAGRPAYPSLHHGAKVQAVIDAAVLSAGEQRWVAVKY
jgi:predicted dehydrogenase